MEINQNEDEKTEKNPKSVSIVLNEESIKEQNFQYENNVSIHRNDNIIQIKNILGIKYFKFGKTIHFYFCCIKNIKYKLSEIPTPFFTLGPECK